jgi:glutathione peroxidase
MSVYDFEVLTGGGQRQKLDQFQGKVLLIVNTASRCGFTPQLKELQEIHEQYHSSGFAVLAFPCNQFGAQEPGSDEEIQHFCSLEYKATFPIFSKIRVNGEGEHGLFTYLKEQCPGIMGSKKIKWNFTKFLIGKDGQPVSRYAPATSPSKIESDIKRELGIS